MRRSLPVYGRIRDAELALHNDERFVRFRQGLYTDHEALENGPPTNLYAVYDLASDAVKIGVALVPRDRLIGLQIGNSRPLVLLACCPATQKLETRFHTALKPWALSGEWFRATPEVLAAVGLITAAEDIADDMAAQGDASDPGMSIHWMAFEFFEAEVWIGRAA